MKIKPRIVILLLFVGITTGCINNDISLPYIKGDVTAFEVSGALSASKIDPANNLITVELSDTTNIESVLLTNITLVDDATSTLYIGERLDLSSDVTFIVTTYQQYTWTIKTTQVIDRHIELSGQIGSAVIDVVNCNAVVSVASSQALDDITVEEFQLGPSNAVTTPDPFSITDFSLPVYFTVSCHGKTEEWCVVVDQTQETVITGASNAWGQFAYLYGSITPSSGDVASFEYRASGSDLWSSVEADVSGSAISAKATGLKANTSYEFRAVLGSDVGLTSTFTTEDTPVVENMNFDDWVLSGKKWYPNASGSNSYWATGNEGVVTAGKDSNTSPVEGDEAVSGAAVKMETIDGVILAKIAAGNIFTGIYNSGLPTEFEKMKALVVMGRPYTGRPTSLKGWYKYFPEAVNLAADPDYPFTDSMGKNDWAHIYVTLENWGDATDRPVDDAIITVAHGELRQNQTVSNYTEFEFPIVYNTMDTYPTHIVMVATPSINGGDFCGGVGSTLYIDEFEFGFD